MISKESSKYSNISILMQSATSIESNKCKGQAKWETEKRSKEARDSSINHGIHCVRQIIDSY